MRDSAVQPRKKPVQRRARATIAVIVEAGAQVLTQQGISGFTTNHIAERAGVSVGTIYQYFPNKEAILVALQLTEMRQTLGLIALQLNDTRASPKERMRNAIRAFLDSEQAELDLRRALAQVRVSLPKDGEVVDIGSQAVEMLHAFLVANGLIDRGNRFASECIVTTITSVGERANIHSDADVERWTEALVRMINVHLDPDRP